MVTRNNHKVSAIIIIILGVLCYVTMVTVNALANILPLNGQNTGQVSDKYPTLFAPAGLTFSIWGVIYLLMFIFVIFQIQRIISNKTAGRLSNSVIFVFALSCIFNAVWIFAWHYENLLLSVVFMILLLSSLLFMYVRIDQFDRSSFSEHIAVRWPVSIYLGWISVATIANVSALLVSKGWNTPAVSESMWTVIMIIVGALLAVLMLFLRKNYAFALVVVWAYFGIILKRNSQEIIYSDIVMTTWIAIGVIIIVMFITFLRKKLLPAVK
jgi:hypothetical protein